MADSYAPTRALQQAVRGHETAVLAALGIAWQGGAQHIACPYPDHADQNPSWRWHERKARAYCTCIERSHSIFDVVMRCEGIDFEAAKLRVAGILGRHDLIKVRDGERHQAMDAASLLRPPAEQRDDDLVRSYLAWRLDVPPEQVPMPATPVAGWRSLAYYDPPAGRGGKPRLVGHYSCAVFGTLAPDGRRHAHRIYVALTGQGKAELGVDSRGRPRDPKKSARLKEGQSAAGCVVLWGDAATAPHLILCGRNRNGRGRRPGSTGRDRAGAEVVAAALSTSRGQVVRSPGRRPARSRLQPTGTKIGRQTTAATSAGERAARAFALAHHEA